jgi:hypothetical protein
VTKAELREEYAACSGRYGSGELSAGDLAQQLDELLAGYLGAEPSGVEADLVDLSRSEDALQELHEQAHPRAEVFFENCRESACQAVRDAAYP